MNEYKVYMLTFPNNKKYIGITKRDVEKRWNNGEGYNQRQHKVYEAIQNFGWENVIKEILYENLSSEDARKLEMEMIEKYNSMEDGYNGSKGGEKIVTPIPNIEYNGKLYTSEELAKMSPYDLDSHDITTRVNGHKWSIEKALNTPKQRRYTKFEYLGEYLTIKELYEKRINLDLTFNQIKNRILQGWEIERALSQSVGVKKQPYLKKLEYNGEFYTTLELSEMSPIDISPKEILDRLQKGWSVERAITQPKRKR